MPSPSNASLGHTALGLARGSFADGFEPVAKCFARLLETGEEIGAGVSIYVDGKHVVDLHGGVEDVRSKKPWRKNTRIVVFSATKGFTAMALNLLADRGKLEWDAPVATYWPEFGTAGKQGITARALFNHQAGLPFLDETLTLDDVTDPARADFVSEVLARQAPKWEPNTKQGYHATTYGLYAKELFQRISDVPLGDFLRQELFEPLGSDVHLGTPASEDANIATLYPTQLRTRVRGMLATSLIDRDFPEARIFRTMLGSKSVGRRTFLNPQLGAIANYNLPPARRTALAWASATASADGVARAYLPFALDGEWGGRRFIQASTLRPIQRRQGWSERDAVLHKPMGWSQGFLKEQRHLFSPNPESFGHSGLGGALGWCDPIKRISFGYVLNRLDWRVRSARSVALCRALYECEPIAQTR